jgi:predicted nucleic acid-binding protein
MILVDTSVWVDYFNGHASKEAERLYRAIADNETICLPDIVCMEILLGIKTESQAARIAGLLEAFENVAELTREDYLDAARLYRRCRAKAYTIRSTIDCVIAQICLRDGHELLSKDGDFQKIAECAPLRLMELAT